MHMQDALLSPAVGGAFWAASIGLIGYSCKKVESHLSESIVPLMGVTGAFVFAAQMINFTIPGTGSSGHLGGGNNTGHPAGSMGGLYRDGIDPDGASIVFCRRGITRVGM